MALSYSAISTYQTCPLQYRYRYIEKKPSLPSPALSFGQSLHEALRWFYDLPTPDPRPLAELLDYLDRCWVSDGYESAEQETRYYCQAKSVLELYYRNNAGDFRIPAALEYRFDIDVGICRLSGVIDRLDKVPDGGFEIIDYKTNRRLPPVKKLHGDLQLPIYHMATERIWGVSPSRVTFYYLIQNHRHSFTITSQQQEKALLEIDKVVSGIDRGAFDPRKNPLCPWCDFVHTCPAWEGSTRPRRSSRSEWPPPLEIGEAVDELVSAEKQVSCTLARMESIKDLVYSYLNGQPVRRVEGSRGFAAVDDEGNLIWGEKEPDGRGHGSRGDLE